jgi:thiamine biosynthesis lipoprotein
MIKYLLALLLTGMLSNVYANWHKHSFDVMGTQAKVELWEPDEQRANKLIQSVVDEMNRIDQLMSPYIESSQLSQLNKLAGEQAVKVSHELFDVIKQSVYFSTLSDGAFDITFASVGFYYDYRDNKFPSDTVIENTKPLINYRSLVLDDTHNTIAFKKPGVKVDLGGIAKGYAVDKCIELLKKADVSHAFVQAGGDSRLLGDKRGRLWSIGIQHPRQENKVLTQLPAENVAISTSGDYERFFIHNDERIHHIIDPSTGRSSKQSISVTVIANDSITADALSTSVFVLGAEKGLALINSLDDVSAIIINNNGKLFYSSDLMAN